MAVSCVLNSHDSEKNIAMKIDIISLHSFLDKQLNLEVDYKTDNTKTDLFIQGHLFLQKATVKLQLPNVVIIFIKGHLQIRGKKGY